MFFYFISFPRISKSFPRTSTSFPRITNSWERLSNSRERDKIKNTYVPSGLPYVCLYDDVYVCTCARLIGNILSRRPDLSVFLVISSSMFAAPNYSSMRHIARSELTPPPTIAATAVRGPYVHYYLGLLLTAYKLDLTHQIKSFIVLSNRD